jgi:hypothetical protein
MRSATCKPACARFITEDRSPAMRLSVEGVEAHPQQTVHYPYATSRYQTDEELTSALRALGGDEAIVVIEGEGLARLTLLTMLPSP